MSAIAAVVSWRNVVDPAVVERLLDRMPHRTANGRRTWAETQCVMGHGRYVTTSRQLTTCQPFVDERRGLAVVLDGRLDNRDELRATLGRDDLTDPQILAGGYDCWGTDLAQKLAGDFAVLIWDTRQRQLFACRDAFGVRPLFYHANDRRLAFASEVEALLGLDDV